MAVSATDGAEGPSRRKAIIVTNHVPGHDIGFAKSGHAQYLQSFISYLCEEQFDVVLVVLTPRVDFIALPTRKLKYRIVGPDFRHFAGRIVNTTPSAALSIVAWSIYSRLPHAVQVLGSGIRTLFRNARGYGHVLGEFLDESAVTFVRHTIDEEHPDLVLYDGIFNTCETHSDAQHWVLTHEVKYQRARSFAERGVPVLPQRFSKEQERHVLSGVGNIIAIQWDDEAEFLRLVPDARVVVVPASMNPPRCVRNIAPSPARFIFVGSGSFHNVDGIRWFLDSCWPAIRAAVPQARLDVYGSVCLRLGKVPPGVSMHGVAASLDAAYASAAVAIVPLQIGSGLKVKLIEALAYGMPVVTTPVGAQGLTSLAPLPFLLAATTSEFVDSCIELMTAPHLARELSFAARQCAHRFAPERAFADFAASSAARFDQRARANRTEARPDSPVSPSRICVAVPTYRRVELLPTLLSSLAAQDIDPDVATFEVVIFDNDALPTAAAVVEQWKSLVPFPLSYEHVPEPGLATVRNRTLRYSAEKFDYLAMIDDDEAAEPQWLGALVKLAKERRSEAVVGPVRPVIPVGSPAWINDLRSIETPAYPDGASLRDGWSCNALVDVEAIGRRGVTFDPALNLAGGEDQLFFREMIARGSTVLFAARAVVHESIAPDRLTVRFNLKRAFRRGNSLSYCERRIDPNMARYVIRVLKGVVIMVLGLARMPLSVVRGEAVLVRHASRVAWGLGMLAGSVGRMYQAYERQPKR